MPLPALVLPLITGLLPFLKKKEKVIAPPKPNYTLYIIIGVAFFLLMLILILLLK